MRETATPLVLGAGVQGRHIIISQGSQITEDSKRTTWSFFVLNAIRQRMNLAEDDMDDQPHTYQQVKALITQFTGQANTLVIPRVFIDFTGDHLAALLLSQILYWSDRTTDPDGWFYKTAETWEAETGMSTFQVRRATAILVKLGIETKLRRVMGAPRTHYRVQWADFVSLFLQFLENRETQKSSSLKIEKLQKHGFVRNSQNDLQETAKSIDKVQRLHAETKRERERNDSPARSPAILAYFEILPGCSLTAAQVQKINETVTDLRRWRKTLEEWALNGWDARRIGKILDRYQSGRTMQDERPAGTNGTRADPHERPPLPVIPPAHDLPNSQEAARKLAAMLKEQRHD